MSITSVTPFTGLGERKLQERIFEDFEDEELQTFSLINHATYHKLNAYEQSTFLKYLDVIIQHFPDQDDLRRIKEKIAKLPQKTSIGLNNELEKENQNILLLLAYIAPMNRPRLLDLLISLSQNKRFVKWAKLLAPLATSRIDRKILKNIKQENWKEAVQLYNLSLKRKNLQQELSVSFAHLYQNHKTDLIIECLFYLEKNKIEEILPTVFASALSIQDFEYAKKLTHFLCNEHFKNNALKDLTTAIQQKEMFHIAEKAYVYLEKGHIPKAIQQGKSIQDPHLSGIVLQDIAKKLYEERLMKPASEVTSMIANHLKNFCTQAAYLRDRSISYAKENNQEMAIEMIKKTESPFKIFILYQVYGTLSKIDHPMKNHFQQLIEDESFHLHHYFSIVPEIWI